MTIRTLAPSILVIALILPACAGSSPGKPRFEEGAIVHQSSPAEQAATHAKGMIPEGTTLLYVNGLGCPQCASNVDVQLLRLPGVAGVNVDLSTGIVTLTVKGAKRPTPQQITDKVEDAGFTLAKLESQGGTTR